MTEHHRLAVINRTIIIVITLIEVLIGSGYVVETLRGKPLTLLVILLYVFVGASLFAIWFLYIKDKGHLQIKRISVIGVGIVYALALLTTTNDLMFCIVMPIYICYICYMDYKFLIKGSIVAVLINVGYVFTYYVGLGTTPSGAPADLTTVFIHCATIIIFFITICLICLIMQRVNDDKMKTIEDAAAESEGMLKDVLAVAKIVESNSSQVDAMLEELNSATNSTANALAEISKANQVNTDSIEHQTHETNKIQEQIVFTQNLTNEMEELASNAINAVFKGSSSMTSLKEQTDRMQESSKFVADCMEELSGNANEVFNMMQQISTISNQTNLLALNASIESARAGEAGKGFAVVADQVRVLSEQTKQLTEDISAIVKQLMENAEKTQRTVNDVVEVTEQEKEIVASTVTEFDTIKGEIENLSANVKEVNDNVTNLMAANNVIVDSINQISAVSQEVSASTTEAEEFGNDSKEKASRAMDLMKELSEASGQLKKYTE